SNQLSFIKVTGTSTLIHRRDPSAFVKIQQTTVSVVRTKVRFYALLAAGATLLSACAGKAITEPAPEADDPVCAEMILGAPTELGGFETLKTTAQATTAWGDDPMEAIVLRCGVEELEPTTDECIGVEANRGEDDVDWVISNEEDQWVFTTYGRVPGLELQVPHAFPGDQPTALLSDLSRIANLGESVRTCL